MRSGAPACPDGDSGVRGATWSSAELRGGPSAGGKRRYSVCLRTGRAKSPDLSCPVHAAAQRETPTRLGSEGEEDGPARARPGGPRPRQPSGRRSEAGPLAPSVCRPPRPRVPLPQVFRGAGCARPRLGPWASGPRRPVTPSRGDGNPRVPGPVTSRGGDSRPSPQPPRTRQLSSPATTPSPPP